jgi:Flp pilus assembly protein TadG
MFYRSRTLSLRNSSLSGRLTALLRPRLARIGALAHDRKGVSAVEFGLAAPVFLAALSPVIDLGLAFSEQIRVNQAVEAGAQYAAVNVYNGTTWSSDVQSAMTNATSLSSDATFSPTVGSTTCGCPNSTNTAIVGGYGTPPACTGSCPDNSIPGYYVTISAQVTYTSLMPYSIITNPTLSSTATVRIQ